MDYNSSYASWSMASFLRGLPLAEAEVAAPWPIESEEYVQAIINRVGGWRSPEVYLDLSTDPEFKNPYLLMSYAALTNVPLNSGCVSAHARRPSRPHTPTSGPPVQHLPPPPHALATSRFYDPTPRPTPYNSSPTPTKSVGIRPP